jgi:hypothetical protein
MRGRMGNTENGLFAALTACRKKAELCLKSWHIVCNKQ